MRISIFYVLVCVMLCAVSGYGQTGVSGQLKVDYIPLSNYIRGIDSVKTDSKSDFKRVEFGLEIPLSLVMNAENKPKIWSVFVQSSYAKMQNKNYEKALFPEEMWNAQIGLKHLRPLGTSWSMLVMASVGVYTDMQQITSDDILGQGGVIFIKHFNPNLALGVGPVLTNNFGVPMVLPGIYFNWESQGALHFKITFPEGLELGYRVSEKVDLKAVVELHGMTAEIKVDGESMLLGHQQATAGFRPQFKIGEHWIVELTAGTSLARSFSANSRKLKDIFKIKDHADDRFSTTLYGAAALKWKF